MGPRCRKSEGNGPMAKTLMAKRARERRGGKTETAADRSPHDAFHGCRRRAPAACEVAFDGVLGVLDRARELGTRDGAP